MAEGTSIAGKGTARIAGVLVNCTKIDPKPGKEKRSKMVGMGGVAGDKVENTAPAVDLTVILTPGITLAWLNSLQDVDVDVAMADGRRYAFVGGSSDGESKHSASDGTADVKFECLDCTEF